MNTDTSEKGLETLIMQHMAGTDGLALEPVGVAAETSDAIAAAKAGGSGWFAGHPKDFDRTHALDAPQLFQFLHATQPAPLTPRRRSPFSPFPVRRARKQIPSSQIPSS